MWVETLVGYQGFVRVKKSEKKTEIEDPEDNG